MKQMTTISTIEDLSHKYYKDWLDGKYTAGEFMMPASHLSTMFIDEARSLALAAKEDILAEAETLEEAMNDKIADWRCE
jgi:hypothetical protein